MCTKLFKMAPRHQTLSVLLLTVLTCSVLGSDIGSSLGNGVCLCANEPNVVAIRMPGQSGGVIQTLSTGQCFLSNGGLYHYNGNTWYELKNIGGQIGWVDGFYLSLVDNRQCDPSSDATMATNHVASGTAAQCTVYGTQYNHQQKFMIHGLYCICDDGSPLCSFSGNSCTQDGNVYPDGAMFHLTTKGECLCKQGNIECPTGGSDFPCRLLYLVVMATGGAELSRLVSARNDGTYTVDLDEEANTPRLVIGIDFGTFASGYALQWRSDFKKDRLKIKVNTKWDAEGFCTNKTLTCLLLDPDQNIVAFGYSAEKMYAEMDIEDRSKYFLFRYFKMALYHRENLNDRTPIESENGTPLPAIDVFTHSIAFMKESVLEYLSESDVLFPEDKTTWVLTVPAIWDDMAIGIMGRAAVKAGIKYERLSIALEPKTAAIYCSLLSTDQLTGTDQDGNPIYVGDPGSKLMITDLGGGTVDITSVEVNQDGTMRQLCRPGGGAWGGRKVNIKFTQLMKDLVGEYVYTKFSRDYPEEEYDFQMRFESKKRNVKTFKEPRNGKDEFSIKLPSKLKKVWENNTGSKITVKDLLNRGPFNDKVTFRSGSLFFPLDLIRELFDETVEEIISYTKRLLNKLDEQLTAMLLVGVFFRIELRCDKSKRGPV